MRRYRSTTTGRGSTKPGLGWVKLIVQSGQPWMLSGISVCTKRPLARTGVAVGMRRYAPSAASLSVSGTVAGRPGFAPFQPTIQPTS